jgi:hypothetical protein
VFFPEMKGGKFPGNFGRSQEVGNPAAARIERFETPNSESAKESEIHALAVKLAQRHRGCSQCLWLSEGEGSPRSIFEHNPNKVALSPNQSTFADAAKIIERQLKIRRKYTEL